MALLRHTTLFAHSMVAASMGLMLGACMPSIESGEEDPDEVLGITSGPKGRSLRELGFTSGTMGSMGTPDYLYGRLPAAIGDGAGARALFMNLLGEVFRLAPGTDFRVIAEKQDGQGYRYIRLQQLHHGVPVIPGEAVLQLAEDGAVVSVLGQLLPGLTMVPTPGMSGDAAVAGALRHLSGGRGRTLVHVPPELHILALERGQVLTYRATVEYLGASGPQLERIYVDARTGQVVEKEPLIRQGLSRSIYDLGNRCLQTGSELPGTLLMNEGGSSSDQTAMTVYNHTGATYWFYKHMFGRDSYDGAGAPLKSSVHVKFGAGASCSGANAAWIGAPYNQMVYGDGDGAMFKPLISMDVTAHELTHAVTDKTSQLIYSNESGAINEAMSDILGAAAEAWKASGGSAAGSPASISVTADTWKIGEDVAGPGLPGGALRFMNNPTADGYSRDYYPERLTGPADNGGVHGNSGIANLAFYLLSQGGSHPRGKTTTVVPAISLAKAVRIFYKANVELLTSSARFQNLRNATAQAAQTLFGSCSPEWTATHKAWDAVGVPGTWTPCGTGGDTTAPNVSLSSPAQGATLSGTVTLSANASDDVGVTVVEFYRGTALIGTDSTSPYAVSFDTKTVPNGSTTFSARARDAAGNVGTSAAVTVTVNNTAGGGDGGTMTETEPNGSPGSANRVSVSGTEITGFMPNNNDIDYYRIELPAGKTLTATLTPPPGSDFDLYIYNSNLVLIGLSEKEVGLVDQVSVTNRGAQTFTRYIRVHFYSGASRTNPYKLKLAW